MAAAAAGEGRDFLGRPVPTSVRAPRGEGPPATSMSTIAGAPSPASSPVKSPPGEPGAPGLTSAASLSSQTHLIMGPAKMPMVSLCLAPGDAYQKIVDKGVNAASSPWIRVFHQAFVGGCYIGFGGLLSMVIAGQLPNSDPGTQKFVFAALFPVNLLLILLTGGSLFTGNCAGLPAAVFEGKIHWGAAVKMLVVSWLGNFMAAALFAALTEYTELCPTDFESGTGCGFLAAQVVKQKVSKDFGKTFVKGIMCNWMVCMATFLCSQAQDMTGKMVGIWFPISAFVAMGMEHSVANMFMLPLGLICGSHFPDGEFGVTFGETLYKNMLPVSLGNFFAGAVCVAASYSYAFGKLGKLERREKCAHLTKGCLCQTHVAKEDQENISHSREINKDANKGILP